MTEECDEKERKLLRHMLGCDGRQPGYRNRFCASVNSPDWLRLKAMEARGLVTAGVLINKRRDQYFHATALGCELVGVQEAHHANP